MNYTAQIFAEEVVEEEEEEEWRRNEKKRKRYITYPREIHHRSRHNSAFIIKCRNNL